MNKETNELLLNDGSVDGQATEAALEPLPEKKDNRCLAVVAMNINAFSMTAMTATFKVIALEGFHPAEFNVFRNLAPFLVACFWCACQGTNPFTTGFPTERKWQLLGRCLFGQTNFVCYSVAITFAPMALGLVCIQTNPFWISLIACLALGEPIIGLEIVGMIICFSAVVLIAIQAHAQEQEGNLTNNEDEMLFTGIMFGVLSAFVYAITCVFNRSLKTVPTSIIIFYHTLGGVIFSVCYILIEKLVTGNPFRFVEEYTARQYLIASVSALFSVGELYGGTTAYQADSSGFVALISYLCIVYAYFCDVFYFETPLDTLQLIGVATILVTAVTVAYFKIRQANAAKQKLDDFQTVEEPITPAQKAIN